MVYHLLGENRGSNIGQVPRKASRELSLRAALTAGGATQGHVPRDTGEPALWNSLGGTSCSSSVRPWARGQGKWFLIRNRTRANLKVKANVIDLFYALLGAIFCPEENERSPESAYEIITK